MASSFDVEIRNALARYFEAGILFLQPSQSSMVLRELEKHFPVRGARIAWTDTQHWTHSRDATGDGAHGFVDEVTRRYSLAGPSIYVADGPYDDAIAGELRQLREILPYLLSFPPHHYIIGPAFGWAFCFSFEGNMDFGFAPSPSALAS